MFKASLLLFVCFLLVQSRAQKRNADAIYNAHVLNAAGQQAEEGGRVGGRGPGEGGLGSGGLGRGMRKRRQAGGADADIIRPIRVFERPAGQTNL
ncbi:hypothetical protein M3Y99_00467600 [Aphelenchoides fujianensis]|nr:hypothetical protein M3Y99_00467600 [Aphelenchoides fujianensis]